MGVWGSDLVLQGGAHGDGDHAVVAGEDLLGALGLGLLGQQGDGGDEDQTHHHGQHTCVDGGAAEVAQHGVLEGDLTHGIQDELGHGDAQTGGEADPHGGLLSARWHNGWR